MAIKRPGPSILIRAARLKDTAKIYQIGTSHKEFAVSKKIRFYEKKEISEWISSKPKNIFLVAEQNHEVIGFMYCKIMSYHWAMIDSGFVLPTHRHSGAGAALLQTCLKLLKSRKVKYVSMLAKPKEFTPTDYKRIGFSPQSEYIWADKFISL